MLNRDTPQSRYAFDIFFKIFISNRLQFIENIVLSKNIDEINFDKLNCTYLFELFSENM